MSLTTYHRRFPGSVRWRCVPAGVDIEGDGVQRTPGQPLTVRRIWQTFRVELARWSTLYGIPVELLIATAATESGGDARARRNEPGWTGDETTPHRVSIGLMQTLISTARAATGVSWTARELFEPNVSILAGGAYIRQQYEATGFDPPLVAAAYNAGVIAEQRGAGNRWKLRQYKLGTGEHLDRFVQWFGDAVALKIEAPCVWRTWLAQGGRLG